ncbi:hypothetical protein V6N12_016850 [Hibiscus sabdariffa]|uniref:SMAX1-like nucleotide binding domain-containing protein n=1 Tax=Hibiscus sabdariffa TaxID=183260 RepID=A0ABR2BPP1_9ROSI
MELKRLVSGTKESGKLFFMGIATFRTYMKCKTGHLSLETIWELYPLTISADSLRLGLNLERELTRHIFDSQTNFASISLSDFGSKRADSNQDNKRKRSYESGSGDVLQRFSDALNENPHKVFFVEDIQHVDYCCLKRIKQAIESRKVTVSDGVTVPVMDAIVIFSCESSNSMSRACSSRRSSKIIDPKEMKESEKYLDKDQSIKSLFL